MAEVPVRYDPWKECELIFHENEGHFIERAKDRSYSGPDYREFLMKGNREPEGNKDFDGQNYKITYGRWVIKCRLRRCNIVMGTIYLNR